MGRERWGLEGRTVCIDLVVPFEGSAVSEFWISTLVPGECLAQFNIGDNVCFPFSIEYVVQQGNIKEDSRIM